MAAHYHIYVVELDRQVWHHSAKFRFANQHYTGKYECLYVGITAQSPKVRFAKHKSGYKTKKGIKISSVFVEKYGKYLRPSLYQHYNPLSKEEAMQMESELAEKLKRKGYAVWWN